MTLLKEQIKEYIKKVGIFEIIVPLATKFVMKRLSYYFFSSKNSDCAFHVADLVDIYNYWKLIEMSNG